MSGSTKNIRFYLFSGIFLVIFFASCQNYSRSFYRFESTDTSSSKKVNTVCTDPANYAPSAQFPEYTPFRYIKINIHFLRDDNGNFNFSEEDGKNFARDLVYIANEKLLENQKMYLPPGNNTPVLPIRYQYVITPDPSVPGDDGVYFHNNTELAFFTKGPDNNIYSTKQYDTYGVQKGEVINVFFLEHHPDSIQSRTYKASSDGAGLGPWAKMVNSYNNSLGTVNINGAEVQKWAWTQVGLFNHELGHCFGLAHTWGGQDGCDDTPAHSNCWNRSNTPPCDTHFSNNMMDYNVEQNSLTPCQLGKIHYNFSQPRARQRAFLERRWCKLNPQHNITIVTGDSIEWKCNKDLEGNIRIQPGGKLSVHCRLSMPEGSKITVMPGGTLVLDGSTLTNDCGLFWQGIEVITRNGKKGEVILMNNPVVEFVLNS